MEKYSIKVRNKNSDRNSVNNDTSKNKPNKIKSNQNEYTTLTGKTNESSNIIEL